MSDDYQQYFTENFKEKVARICFKAVEEEIGTNNIDLQKEVAAETLFRLWANRTKIDFVGGHVWGYTKAVARNYLRDLRKKNTKDDKKFIEFMPGDELPGQIHSINYDLLVDDLKKITLDPINQKIIERWMAGYETASEILPVLKKFGIKDTSAVSKRLKKIKAQLKKYYYEES